MTLKSKFWISLRVAAMGFGLSACQVLSSAEDIVEEKPSEEQTGPKVTFDALRAKDPQSKIGAQGHPKVLKAHGGAYDNEKLETLLALVTGRLVAKSNDPGRAYDITVLNSSSVNAFALPGGYLYVTRGLLALANDAAEVATVLSHEMAHISSNHGVQRSKEAQAVSMADRVADQVVSNPVVAQVAKASTERRLASFSQAQELQADAVGIKVAGAAGFDPFAAARFLQSMDRYSAWRSAAQSRGLDMSSTHPSTPQRIELAKRHARTIGPEGIGERKRDRYLQGIDGLIFGESAKDGYIRGNKFLHVKLGFVFSVPAGFDINNGRDAVLASGPNQMALRFDSVSDRGHKGAPSSYLKSGWVNGLDESSITPLKVNGLSAAQGLASTEGWRFVVTVVEFKNRFYRFIMAAPRSATNLEQLGKSVPKSFRELTKSEKSSVKPLRLKIVTVKSSDTIARMGARMVGVSRKVDLFRALNGLDKGDRLKAGTKVKLVVE